jgi:electron transport complex protein RnfB
MSTAAATLVVAAVVVLVVVLLLAYVLGVAKRVFHVPVDRRVAEVDSLLPATHCGSCGYVGCGQYAEAVVKGEVGADQCLVGGQSIARQVAGLLGVPPGPSWPVRPIVHCAARSEDRLQQADYRGEPTCHAANLVAGVQGCVYGCLGLGDCVRACEYEAMRVIDGVAQVDYERCTGCGACAEQCPRHIITMTPFKARRILAVLCATQDRGSEVEQVCRIGCIGCQSCVERSGGLITEQDGLRVIDYQRYDPVVSLPVIGAVLQNCPRESLVWVGRPSAQELDAAREMEAPRRVEASFQTSVDETEWRG